ncbi:MAG: hypothetical protein A4E19_05970 [Nitrospira sp. SG-bin1]|nr:MAG: hypothetical protein A4E19_05970 [Nitrospira sp. SG-bin1]
MLLQHIYYEICTEDQDGFNPREGSYDSLAEAQKELALFRRRWPSENAFVVRLTMTRVSKSRHARLKAV